MQLIEFTGNGTGIREAKLICHVLRFAGKYLNSVRQDIDYCSKGFHCTCRAARNI